MRPCIICKRAVSIQYTAMPLAAYGVGRMLGLDGPLMIGVIMVGCVPGAMASNVSARVMEDHELEMQSQGVCTLKVRMVSSVRLILRPTNTLVVIPDYRRTERYVK